MAKKAKAAKKALYQLKSAGVAIPEQKKSEAQTGDKAPEKSLADRLIYDGFMKALITRSARAMFAVTTARIPSAVAMGARPT